MLLTRCCYYLLGQRHSPSEYPPSVLPSELDPAPDPLAPTTPHRPIASATALSPTCDACPPHNAGALSHPQLPLEVEATVIGELLPSAAGELWMRVPLQALLGTLPTWYSVLSTQYFALGTLYCVLRTGYLVLCTGYFVPGTNYPPLTTHYSLPTTHRPLLTAHYSLLTTHYSLLAGTRYLVRTSHFSPLTAQQLTTR